MKSVHREGVQSGSCRGSGNNGFSKQKHQVRGLDGGEDLGEQVAVTSIEVIVKRNDGISRRHQ